MEAARRSDSQPGGFPQAIPLLWRARLGGDTPTSASSFWRFRSIPPLQWRLRRAGRQSRRVVTIYLPISIIT